MALVLYLPVFLLPFWPSFASATVGESEIERAFFARRHFQRHLLASVLAWILFPSFAAIYLLAIARAITPSATVASLHFVAFSTKAFFACVSMDILLTNVLEVEVKLEEERRANESRRQFIKYLFHEVRTPLSSLTMGIDLLSLSTNLDAQDLESLDIMRNASKFMSKTLDGVYVLSSFLLANLP